MERIKKHFLHFIIGLALIPMCLSMVSLQGKAAEENAKTIAEPGEEAFEAWYEISTYANLKRYLEMQGNVNIRLVADITCVDSESGLAIESASGTKILDLNGHNIIRETSGEDTYFIRTKGTYLTIINSGEDENLIKFTTSNYAYPATFLLYSGILTLGEKDGSSKIAVSIGTTPRGYCINGSVGGLVIYDGVVLGNREAAYQNVGTATCDVQTLRTNGGYEWRIYGGTFYGGLCVPNGGTVYDAKIYGHFPYLSDYAFRTHSNLNLFSYSSVYWDGGTYIPYSRDEATNARLILKPAEYIEVISKKLDIPKNLEPETRLYEGETLRLSMDIANFTRVSHIQWRRYSTDDYSEYDIVADGRSEEFILENVSAADAGTYYAVITFNGTETFSHAAKVMITETKCGENAEWSFETRTGIMTISGSGEMYDYDDDNPAPWYHLKDLIQTVNIESGITRIGSMSFMECARLAVLNVPLTVTSVGQYACAYCQNTSFKVVFEGSQVEWNRMITKSGNNGDLAKHSQNEYGSYGGWCGDDTYWRMAKDSTELVFYGEGAIKETDYKKQTGWKTVSILSGITSIPKEAFANTPIMAVTFAKSDSNLQMIGDYAFARTKIDYVVLPEGVTIIGQGAFSGSALEEITLPKTITEIKSYAFDQTDMDLVRYTGTRAQWETIVIGDNNPDLTKLVYGDTPIKIYAQPENITMNSGKQAEFTVYAVGDGLKYQWKYSLDRGQTWLSSSDSSAKTATFRITVADFMNGMRVYCLLTDEAGKKAKTNVATLQVIPGPQIGTQPVSVTADAGDEATFRIKANGDGLTYQWYYSMDEGKSWQLPATAGAKTESFSITAEEKWNGMLLKCEVTDRNGGVSTSNIAKLTVNPAPLVGPEIAAQPVDVTAEAGVKANFSVTATGDMLTYQWYYSMDQGQTWKVSTAAAAKTATFGITAAEKWNGMVLKCVVTDKNGLQVTSNTAKLTVNPPAPVGPQIGTQPADVTAEVGVKATFSVQATGDTLTYQWYYSMDGGKTWKVSTAAAAKTATFGITAADKWNGMILKCVVTDKNGAKVTSNTAKLTVKTPAPTGPVIGTQPANVTVASGVKATFSVAATGEGLTYQWYYSMDGGQTWKVSTASSAKTATFSITGAAKWNGMALKCEVSDASGAKATSDIATLTVQ